MLSVSLSRRCTAGTASMQFVYTDNCCVFLCLLYCSALQNWFDVLTHVGRVRKSLATVFYGQCMLLHCTVWVHSCWTEPDTTIEPIRAVPSLDIIACNKEEEEEEKLHTKWLNTNVNRCLNAKPKIWIAVRQESYQHAICNGTLRIRAHLHKCVVNRRTHSRTDGSDGTHIHYYCYYLWN